MNRTFKKTLMTAAAAIAAIAGAASASAATLITSIEIKNADGIPGQGYLQIAELKLFSNGVNVAPSGVATATSVYAGGSAVATKANDGSTNGIYPEIYHGNASDGSDIFTLTFGAATAIDRISIFGRTDSCCTFRDTYTYTLFDGTTNVGAGTLDARATSFATSAVPETATWAMMLAGFGMIGFATRRRSIVKTAVTFA